MIGSGVSVSGVERWLGSFGELPAGFPVRSGLKPRSAWSSISTFRPSSAVFRSDPLRVLIFFCCRTAAIALAAERGLRGARLSEGLAHKGHFGVVASGRLWLLLLLLLPKKGKVSLPADKALLRPWSASEPFPYPVNLVLPLIFKVA